MKTYAVRLHPHQDLRHELEAFAQARQLKAAFILTCVGSLRHAALRMGRTCTLRWPIAPGAAWAGMCNMN